MKSRRGKSHEWRIVTASLLILFLNPLFTAGCHKKAIEPVELVSEDMCASCRMAISERRFACELIDHDGQAFKFDDLSCLSAFVRGKKSRDQVAAFFVMDYEEKHWVRAENAWFAFSGEIKTPMRGGAVALRDEARAISTATKFNGKVLRFDDVLKLE